VTIPWWLACFISNAAIISIEYINRMTPGGWHKALPKTVLLIVATQWGLYHAWNHAPHWFSAWVVFFMGNTLMRILAVSVGAGSEVNSWPHTLFGIALMAVGALIVKVGLR
jgi:hypothetical membrane protein